MRSASVALGGILLIVLGACSGGSSEPTGPTTSAPAPGTVPSNPPPTGIPVPEALSDFRCEPDGAGTFTATGAVTNRTKAAATFQVTVNVGQPAATPQAAMTKQLAKVGAGDAVTFEITNIPVASEGGTCHVQVVTTR